MVGVNDYLEGDGEPIEILRVDPALERKQIGRVQAVRAPPRRRGGRARRSRRSSEAAADPDVNLMPNLLDCARAYATEGEIVEALQTVFGTYTESPVF